MDIVSHVLFYNGHVRANKAASLFAELLNIIDY